MKIKAEHQLKTLILKGKPKRLLGELSRAEVKQLVAAGYIPTDYIEEPKPRKKKTEDGE